MLNDYDIGRHGVNVELPRLGRLKERVVAVDR
jgi:hypothetical protein